MQTPSRRADKAGMAGTLHQGLLALFLEEPWLAFDVLGLKRPVRGTPIESVPRSWLDEGARSPMAVVLAGALHGYAGDLDAARRAFQFTRTMRGDRRRRHGMTVLAALTQEQRELLIGELPMEDQHDWADVERRSGTYHFGAEEALREVLVNLLAERGLKASAKAKAKIRKCKDLPTLKRWVREAVHATSVAELLAD